MSTPGATSTRLGVFLYELLDRRRRRSRGPGCARPLTRDPPVGFASRNHPGRAAAERLEDRLAVDRGPAPDRTGAADEAGPRRARLDRDEGDREGSDATLRAANGLARDVQRYLDGDAVEAGPPSATYRLRKLARKHRAALASRGRSGPCSPRRRPSASGKRLAPAAPRRASQERDRAVAAEQRPGQSVKPRPRKQGAKVRVRSAGVLQFFRQEGARWRLRPKGYEGGLGKDATLRAAIDAAEPGIENVLSRSARGRGLDPRHAGRGLALPG